MQICFPFVCLVFFHLFQAFYDPLSRPWKRNDTSPSEFSLRMCSAFFCLSFRFPTETLIRHFRYPIRKSHKILLTTMVSFIPSALTIFTAFRNQRRKKMLKSQRIFFLFSLLIWWDAMVPVVALHFLVLISFIYPLPSLSPVAFFEENI